MKSRLYFNFFIKQRKLIASLLFLLIIGINNTAQCQGISLNWAGQTGGNYFDQVISIVADPYGNVYTTGEFRGTADLDPGAGVYNMTSASLPYGDIYISKIDINGNLIWAKAIGSTGYDQPKKISIDADNNVYISGYFTGTVDFDQGTGTYNLVASGSSQDAFLCKMDSAGNFVWAKRFGSTGNDTGFGNALDDSGNVYVSVSFTGTVDFDSGPGTFNLTSTVFDAAICKLDSGGNFVWVKQFSGSNNSLISSFVFDSTGNIYMIGGLTATLDCDPGPGTYNLTSVGNWDIFVCKLDATGNFLWAMSYGGIDNDGIGKITLDNMGNVLFNGTFKGTVDFDPGPGTYNLSAYGGVDIFISKVDANGNFIWCKQIVEHSYDEAISDMVTDSTGNFYATGTFTHTMDIYQGSNVFVLNSAGGSDIFTAKFDVNGNLLWAKRLGGTSDDGSGALTLDPWGNLIASGGFKGTVNFDPASGSAIFTSAGDRDSYMLKCNPCFNFSSVNINDSACDEYVSASGQIYYGSGTYVDIIPNSYNCDSIIILNLTIHNSGFFNVNDTACSSYLSPSGNYVWTTSGTYYDTLQSVFGCDSVLVIALIIKNATTSTIIASTCDSFVSPSGNYTWITSGTYLDILPNADGCDSVITINLTINYNTTSTLTINGCNNYTSPSGNYTWSASGTYMDTIANAGGCDSIITINLTLNSTFSSQNITACNNYTSPSGNYNWTSSGSYLDTIPNANGCDSILLINLTINPLPVSLYTLYPDTTAPHNWFALNQCTGTPPLSYVWNWGDGSAVSTGATPSHVYADSGYFNICVTVTDGNGCVNTYCDSSTYIYKGNGNSIITLNVVMSLPNGIEDIDGNSAINIYPVPVHDVLNVSLNKPLAANSMITISDMQGRVVGEKNTNHTDGSNGSVIPIDVSAFSRGVYLLRMDGVVRRFVKL